MRTTRERLATLFNLSPENADRLRAILARPASAVALEEVDVILGTHGVEGWTTKSPSRKGVSYCNTGDPWTTTVMVRTDREGVSRWSIGCWGDSAEGAA